MGTPARKRREPTGVGAEVISVHHWEGPVTGTSWEHSSSTFRPPISMTPTSPRDYFHKASAYLIRGIIQLHECLGCYGNYRVHGLESVSVESTFQSLLK